MNLFPAGTVLATRYRVLRELGRGGMGVVYLVEHVHTGQELALKVLSVGSGLSKSSVERFQREARAPARIKSENVVTVTDADVLPELGGAPFFVMERLHGRDLEAEVEARGRLPPREVVECLGQAARALDRSHALGIIHRDLKPENLFLHKREDGSSCLKILDFGISKMLEEADGAKAASLTHSGALVGTPLFMSPEQATHGATVTRATDVWSMGLVAIRLLTAEHYWRSLSIAELMVSLLRDPLYAPTSRWGWLPPAIDAWFAQSCVRDAQSRFASVGEQVDALARVFGEPVVPRRSPSAPPAKDEEPPAARAFEIAPTVMHDSNASALSLTPRPSSLRPAPARALLGAGAALVLALLAFAGLQIFGGAKSRALSAPAADSSSRVSPAASPVAAAASIGELPGPVADGGSIASAAGSVTNASGAASVAVPPTRPAPPARPTRPNRENRAPSPTHDPVSP